MLIRFCCPKLFMMARISEQEGRPKPIDFERSWMDNCLELGLRVWDFYFLLLLALTKHNRCTLIGAPERMLTNTRHARRPNDRKWWSLSNTHTRQGIHRRQAQWHSSKFYPGRVCVRPTTRQMFAKTFWLFMDTPPHHADLLTNSNFHSRQTNKPETFMVNIYKSFFFHCKNRLNNRESGIKDVNLNNSIKQKMIIW